MLTGTAAVGSGLLLAAFALSADGYVLPGQIYALLGNPAAGGRLVPAYDVLVEPLPRPDVLREIAFHSFNVKPEARAWMREVTLSYEHSSVRAGAYDPKNDSVRVGQPYLHVLLHEYAHANLDHKHLWEKLQFSAALVRLLFDGSVENGGTRELLMGHLGKAAQAGRGGQTYNPVQEFYADLAQLSGGDLRRVPPSLQPFFDDFLSAEDNEWWGLQSGETGIDALHLCPHSRVVSLR